MPKHMVNKNIHAQTMLIRAYPPEHMVTKTIHVQTIKSSNSQLHTVTKNIHAQTMIAFMPEAYKHPDAIPRITPVFKRTLLASFDIPLRNPTCELEKVFAILCRDLFSWKS